MTPLDPNPTKENFDSGAQMFRRHLVYGHAALLDGDIGNTAPSRRWYYDALLAPFGGLPCNYWVTPLKPSEKQVLVPENLVKVAAEYDFEQDHEWALRFSDNKLDIFLQQVNSLQILSLRLTAGVAAAQTAANFGGLFVSCV
jgi:hypothetical protein